VTSSTTPRPYHHGDLRGALLRQAERTLAERGADGLSLRELAREVGVSHGAPRRHFPDKQALLDALVEEGYERLGRRLDAALSRAEGDFTARLVCFAQEYVAFALEHRALLGLMHTAKEGSEEEWLIQANHRAFAAPIALLNRAREAGDIEPDGGGRVDMTVLAVLQGLAVLAATGMSGDRDVALLVSDTVRTLVAGLRPR
jgi:AcrR family transcriptional regulator